jgi:hypothetical protein
MEEINKKLDALRGEVKALDIAVNAHLVKSAKLETDMVWVKRVVVGAFTFIFTVIASVLSALKQG